MAIMGLLMTLVSQAVHQVAQIARAAERAGNDLQSRWANGWSASNLLANLVAPAMKGGQPPMVGTRNQLRGFSTLTLDGKQEGMAAFELTLSPTTSDDGLRSAGSVMLGRSLPPEFGLSSAGDVNGTSPGVVAQFAEAAEFAYVNQSGQVLLAWPVGPVDRIDSEALPRAILVRGVASGRVLMRYAFPGETAPQLGPGKPFWEQ